MRIAIFDYKVTSTNPAGGCHRRMLEGLCDRHEFTVFAVEFENPCPERIAWVRIPAPRRPLFLLFIVFHVLAPLYLLGHRLRGGAPFDLVQGIESNIAFADSVYAHFCHSAYLEKHWRSTRPPGLRGLARWLDHWLHARFEPFVYSRARHVVVPSRGLARELVGAYPRLRGKLTTITNPVATRAMRPPADFDRLRTRRAQGFAECDRVVLFVALGHFERKGLPLLLEAMAKLEDASVRLLVVGGEPDAVETYRQRADALGLGSRVVFTGMQRDVRPYFWMSDAFALPSSYEIFPLVSLEAAAAGLPVIATPLYGVEDFLVDGRNGFLVERSVEGVGRGLERFLEQAPAVLAEMGRRARQDVAGYDLREFTARWAEFYRRYPKS